MEIVLKPSNKEYADAFAVSLDDRIPDQENEEDVDWKIFDQEEDEDDESYCSSSNTSAMTPKSVVSTVQHNEADFQTPQNPFMQHFTEHGQPFGLNNWAAYLQAMPPVHQQQQPPQQQDDPLNVKKQRSKQRMERNRLSAMRSRMTRLMKIQEDQETIRKLQGRVREMIQVQSTLSNCVRNLSNQFLQVADTHNNSPEANEIQLTMDSVSDILMETHERVLDVSHDPALEYQTQNVSLPPQLASIKSRQDTRGMSGSRTCSSHPAARPR